MVVGITAQALSVRVDDHNLLVSAPRVDFLVGKPLQRLKDGQTVGYLGQLTLWSGRERIFEARSIVHFAFSYDIWEERFRVTVLNPGMKKPIVSKNLTREQAQAWCLDQLKIDLTHVPGDRPVWVRLEMRSEDDRETASIVGQPGISISGLVELFSHPVKNQQVHLIEEVGPLKIDGHQVRPI
jgi:hypothetical protein